MKKRTLNTIPEEEFVISEKDTAVCLGSSDLKPCPFCGRRALSVGRMNPDTKIICYRVMCSNHKCMATTHYSDHDKDKARAGAVKKWNRRI